jgi:hypothetical protein
VQQDIKKTIELWTQAVELGSSSAHLNLGMAGHEAARCNLGIMEGKSGNVERGLCWRRRPIVSVAPSRPC